MLAEADAAAVSALASLALVIAEAAATTVFTMALLALVFIDEDPY